MNSEEDQLASIRSLSFISIPTMHRQGIFGWYPVSAASWVLAYIEGANLPWERIPFCLDEGSYSANTGASLALLQVASGTWDRTELYGKKVLSVRSGGEFSAR